MRLLPGTWPVVFLRGRYINRVMQPPVPLGRHPRGLGKSVVDDPPPLESERGVHRLVRISPFDSNARRHTSFAGVDVIPDLGESADIEINEDDLRIDTYRSQGAGGQHVNKTDSAVRITHLPTGIVVQCQNERSQLQNKARAMAILKARLAERQRLERQEHLSEIRGEQGEAAWGRQVRSYVLQPYQMVKDNRSEYETARTDLVLDGEIDPLIEAYLKSDAAIA